MGTSFFLYAAFCLVSEPWLWDNETNLGEPSPLHLDRMSAERILLYEL